MNGIAVFVLVIGVLLVIGGFLALWRFTSFRSKGTPIIIRPLPAADGAAWRHGVIKYTDELINVYKLRSIRPGADVRLPRNDVEIVSRREPTEVEAGFFDPGLHVVACTVEGMGDWEVAVDASGDTALVAWVESSPSRRTRRALPTNIEERFRNVSERRRGGFQG